MDRRYHRQASHRSLILPLVLTAIGLAVIYGHFFALILIAAGAAALLDVLIGVVGGRRASRRVVIGAALIFLGGALLVNPALLGELFRFVVAGVLVSYGLLLLVERIQTAY